MMAWGITIHKSQGLTLEKVVVELGDKDFSAGLSYVAISRVKTLKGLAFRTWFNHARLKKPKETESTLMLKKDTERRNQLGFQLNTFGMDLSEYVFSEVLFFILSFIEWYVYAINYFYLCLYPNQIEICC